MKLLLKRYLVTSVLCFASLHAGDVVPLAENGLAKAVIVHNGNTNVAPNVPEVSVRQGHIKPPVETLNGYLKQITGVELPVVATLAEAGDKPAIVLELVDKVPGASEKPTGRQAYRLKTDGNRLTLTAASELGLTYAVYGLLEDHLGCRFYTWRPKGAFYGGPGFEVIPQQPTLALAKLDDLQEPVFAQRGFIHWTGSYPWVLQNRGAGYPADTVSGGIGVQLNMYALLPPHDRKIGREEVKGLFAEHPDFYPLTTAGKREPSWAFGICGTNPDLPKFLAAALERDIKRRIEGARGGQVDWSMPFSARPGDGHTPCHCAACRKLVHEEETEVAPLLLALNRTLDILHQDYPQAQLITAAYFDTVKAPKTLRPHANLWINAHCGEMSQNSAGDQVGPIVGNPANRDYAKALRDWPKIAPGRVTTWHWTPGQAEWPTIFYLGDTVKYWQECGIDYVNLQLCGDNWRWLVAWVFLKLAWNPQQDADKLIRQFLDDNYGKAAAPHVWEYLKLAQAAYADSGHVPSAVRSFGWTQTTSVKMIPPSVLVKMTAAMDAALAAAEKEGDPMRLANMIEARGNSLDVITVIKNAYSGAPWGPVKNPRDGKNWFVAGADPLVPACIERAKKAIVMNGGGEDGVLRTISRTVANRGGPLVELTGPALTAAVCPDFKGQITSVVDKSTGKELLAGAGIQVGYGDVFEKNISSQIWLPTDKIQDLAQHGNHDWSTVWSEFQNPAADKLDTVLVLSPAVYGLTTANRLARTVAVTNDGVRVARQFAQGKLADKKSGLPATPRFSTRWLLALPDSTLAKVAVKGGGISKILDLKHAVPGGIVGVKAGERLPGLDAMEQRFDEVFAVSDAEPVTLTISNTTGDVTVQLDRGDGVAAVLTTPATGWDAVEIKPVVDKKYVQVTFLGTPVKLGMEATTLDLPAQTLSAKSVPAAKPVTATASAPATVVAVKVKDLGNGRGLNERDGAELIWIPAGEFLRGSDKCADERPQRKVTLDGCWIYKHPVTLAQYQKFCTATGKEFKPVWGQDMHADPRGDDGQYAVIVNWYEAEAYAKWAGVALPTEAQWEKAARGTDGREYPWGNTWEPAKCVSMEETLYKFSTGFRPVGSYPAGASPYGVLDMAGNCWEWVNDWYGNEYYRTAPDQNPTGPGKGSHKVLRGGCSLFDERLSRTAARMIMPPHVRDWTPTGFRCVVNGDR